MKKRTALVLASIFMAMTAMASENIGALKREMALKSGAEQKALVSELVKALTIRGNEEQKRQDFRAALATYGEALALLKKFPGLSPSPHLLNKTGLVKLIMGDYDQALDFLLKSLAAAEDAGDRAYITQSAYLIGYAHRDLGNLDLSLRYFHMARESSLAGNDPYYTILSLNEIGNVYVYQKSYEQALLYKESSLKQAREHNQPALLAVCLHDMGNLYLSQDRAARALPFFQESLAINRKRNLEREIIITLLNTADCDLRLGRFSAALVCLDEAQALAEKLGLAKSISDILLMYSHVHEEMKDYRQALSDQRRYQELRERLFNEEKAKQTAVMQTRFEMEKKQRENELLKQEKRINTLALAKQRSQRNFLFYLALLVMLLAGVLYSRFRIKARTNRKLEAANSQIVSQRSQLEKAYHKMEDLARRDQLTGLPNRRAAMEEIEREAKRFQRSRKPFTLVMTDLDDFKIINDTRGHDAGDFVLQAAAGIFSSSLRAQDMVSRWGGDEFLFLLPETDAKGAQVFCSAIRDKIGSHEFTFKGHRLRILASMGSGTFRAGIGIEECLREADQEMYRSRRC